MFTFRTSQLAARINLGAALTYGPTPSLPYEKRFYGGGSNSMRAWPVRRIGPGAYGVFRTPINDIQPIAIIDYQLEQGGEMIIEANLEYRKKVLSFFDYALFVDVGNIWRLTDGPPDDEGDDGRFRVESFLGELAVGAGLGLRFDFSFLIFRLDGGFQIVDPAQPRGSRYILDDLNLLAPLNGNKIQKEIFNNKTNLNIGIGLPF